MGRPATMVQPPVGSRSTPRAADGRNARAACPVPFGVPLQCRSGRITHHARHVTVEFRVPRTVDLPHPPAPMGAAQPWRQLLIYRLSLPAQKSLANGSTSAISKVMPRRSDRRTFIKAISGAVCASPFMLAAQSAAGGRAQLLTPLRFVVASDGHFGQPDTNYEKFHEEMMGGSMKSTEARASTSSSSTAT